ncbi:MAG: hypothetical protein HPY59_04195 [Anaerolineae bacterium]|nr:hypothetical protein [Anaerolineae bacterium]
MTAYTKQLFEFIQQNHLNAVQLLFQCSTHSVAEAAQAVGATAEDFVKNICMIAPNGGLIVAIVKGEDRASPQKIGKLLGIPTPRLATPEEILALSGYPCGGTPSFGYSAVFLVDERVLEKDIVYTGGGDENALVRVSPAELLKANGGKAANIRKE